MPPGFPGDSSIEASTRPNKDFDNHIVLPPDELIPTISLLCRLDHDMGIRGVCLKWFESYLRDRRQTLRLSSASPEDRSLASVRCCLIRIYLSSISDCSQPRTRSTLLCRWQPIICCFPTSWAIWWVKNACQTDCRYRWHQARVLKFLVSSNECWLTSWSWTMPRLIAWSPASPTCCIRLPSGRYEWGSVSRRRIFV